MPRIACGAAYHLFFTDFFTTDPMEPERRVVIKAEALHSSGMTVT